MDAKAIERALAALPLTSYAIFSPSELEFSEKVRVICETDCPMYGKSWSCPPAVGTVAACRKRCLAFSHVLALTTADLDEQTVREAEDCLPGQKLTLSGKACTLCSRCTCPDSPCRHPERMHPCIESHGILVTALADRLDAALFASGNWFTLIFFNADGENR